MFKIQKNLLNEKSFVKLDLDKETHNTEKIRFDGFNNRRHKGQRILRFN